MNNDTRTKSMMPFWCQLWTDFTLCSSVYVVYLEQVNAHLVKCSFVIDFFMTLLRLFYESNKKIVENLYIVKADERLVNLGAASMEGDILGRQYNSVKWYWFCEHWIKYHLKCQCKMYYY